MCKTGEFDLMLADSSTCKKTHCVSCTLEVMTTGIPKDIHYSWKCWLKRHKKSPRIDTEQKAKKFLKFAQKACVKNDIEFIGNIEKLGKPFESFLSEFKKIAETSYIVKDVEEYNKIRLELAILVSNNANNTRDRPGVH